MRATAAQLRRRIAGSEQAVNVLAGIALNPRTRSVLARAKTDLDTASKQLVDEVDGLTKDKLDAWLALVEERVEAVRHAITTLGPHAIAPPADKEDSKSRR